MLQIGMVSATPLRRLNRLFISLIVLHPLLTIAAAEPSTASTSKSNLRWLQSGNASSSSLSTTATDAEDFCPPCPLQCPEVVQCPIHPPETTPAENVSNGTAVDPLVLQILVVDSPGIITMGKC